MLNLSFSAEQIEELRSQRFNHPHPWVQRKMEALLLKAAGLSHGKIAEILDVCPNTLRDYFVEYQNGGIEELKKLPFNKPSSELIGSADIIKKHFEESSPATIKEAAAKIELITGIKRGRTQVGKFLNSLGMKRRKTGSIPSKADDQAQVQFKTGELEPRLEEARNGQRVVFFMDAAHFVFAPFLGFLWCFTRLFVRAPSGRKRFNVLGALNAVTHELITFTNTAYINSQCVCSLLHTIAENNTGMAITIVLDNARYQRCALVQQTAQDLKIELLFLPPYSPNLNLIERVWKFTKRHCLNSRYYPDFGTFSSAIGSFLSTAHTTHKAELASLISHRFQDFGKIKIAFTD